MTLPWVAFDVDGVLVDFVLAYTEAAHKAYGTPVLSTGEQLTWAHMGGLTNKQSDAVWEHIKTTEHWWEDAPSLVTDGDRRALRRLSEQAHIIYVTNRRAPADVVAQTRHWLCERGLYFDTSDVASVDNKAEYLRNRFSWWEEPLLIGVIDDSPRNIAEISMLTKLPLYVMDWPYNRGANRDVPRVTSVAEYCSTMEYVMERLSLGKA